ncbi:MAG: ATP-binding cassette domain-containing protein, partial [Clostridia bacterium]
VSKEYIKQRPILSNVAFEIEPNEKIAFMGADNAGKSTLFRIMSKLDTKFDGDVLFDGVSVRKLNQRQLQLAYLTDELMLQNEKTVLDNACYGLKIRGEKKDVAREKATPFLTKFDLFEKADTLVKDLDIFDKIKTATCRAIARNPQVVILDDILKRVAEESQTAFMARLSAIIDGFDVAVINAVSTIPLGKTLSRRTIVLNEGKVSFDGAFQNSPYANVDESDE